MNIFNYSRQGIWTVPPIYSNETHQYQDSSLSLKRTTPCSVSRTMSASSWSSQTATLTVNLLNDEIGTLKRQNDKLYQDKRFLTSSLRLRSSTSCSLPRTMSASSWSSKSATLTINYLKDEMITLRRQNDELDRDKRIRIGTEHALRLDLHIVESERDDNWRKYLKELERNENLNDELDGMDQNQETLLEEIHNLQRELNRNDAEIKGFPVNSHESEVKLQNKIETLTCRNHNLEERSTCLEQELKQTKEMNEELIRVLEHKKHLNAELAKLQEEKEGLKLDVRSLTARNVELQRDDESKKSREVVLQSMQADLRQFQKEIEDLNQKLNTATERNTELEKLHQENKTIQRESGQINIELQREHESIQGTEEVLQSVLNRNRNMQAELDQFQKVIEDLKRNLHAATARNLELEKLHEEDKNSQRESTQRYAREEAELNETKRQCENLKRVHQENSSYAEKVAQLEAELHELNESYEDLKRRYEDIKTENERSIKGNEDLKRQHDETKRENEETMKSVFASNSNYQAHLSKAKEENESLRKQVHTLSDSVSAASRLSRDYQAQLSKAEEEKGSLKHQINVLTNRLAAEINTKIAADEQCFENISIDARPLKIAEAYDQFFSNTWLDAKMALDDTFEGNPHCNEELKVKFLFSILYVAYDNAKSLYEAVKQQIVHHLEGQTCQPQESETRLPKSTTAPMPQCLTTGISDFLRSRADKQNLEEIIVAVYGALRHQESENEFNAICIEIDALKQYVTECARLVWKMVLQRPQMELVADHIGKPWMQQLSLELMWGSEPKNEGALIRYYKSPALYHGGKCMVKGSVYIA